MLSEISLQKLVSSYESPNRKNEELSTYIVSNYLFKNIDNKLKFFDDINNLFKYYLNKYSKQYITNNLQQLQQSQIESKMIDIGLDEKRIILKENIKLIYKGGNMLNEHIKQHLDAINTLGIDYDLDTLSDFDFSIFINYRFILREIGLDFNDKNLLNLTNLGNVIASSITRHFVNNVFCYDKTILKTKLTKKISDIQDNHDIITVNSTDLDSFKTYELGSISNEHRQKLTNKISQHYNSMPRTITEDVDDFIRGNKTKIENNEYKDNISVLFDILRLKYDVSLDFIGFSLPTTFNKHKEIYNELQNITAENSIKLNNLIKLIVSPHSIPNETMSNKLKYDKRKIKINQKLRNINSRFDRVKTVISEIYPSNAENTFGTFIPTKIIELYNKRQEDINLDNIIFINDNLSLNKFYNVKSDDLNLYEDVDLQKMHISDFAYLPAPYSQTNIAKINSTNENMLNMSANYSLLFGVLNDTGMMEQVSNFNLFRNKMPVRYYFKLNKIISIENKDYEYIFFDFNGEFIDISIPLIGDSIYREDTIGNNDNFNNYISRINIYGSLHQNVSVETLSIKYNIHDNLKMLFIKSTKIPWKQQKYEKRLMRLIMLLLIELKNEYDYEERLLIYGRITRYINSFSEQYTKTKSINVDYKINIHQDLSNNHELILFIDAIYELHKILKSDEDKCNMKKFLNIIKCYMKSTDECLRQNPNVVNLKSIEFLRFQPFLMLY